MPQRDDKLYYTTHDIYIDCDLYICTRVLRWFVLDNAYVYSMRMCVNAHVYVRVCMNHSILMYTYCNFDGVRLFIHTHICISVYV